jgi:hypothetical protein
LVGVVEVLTNKLPAAANTRTTPAPTCCLHLPSRQVWRRSVFSNANCGSKLRRPAAATWCIFPDRDAAIQPAGAVPLHAMANGSTVAAT